MISIHLKMIDHTYDNSKSASSFPDQAMDADCQQSASAVNVPMTWPFQRAEKYDLLDANERQEGQ